MITKKSLKISEEKKKEGKNPSRDAFVTLPRRFCDRFRGSFFTVLRRSSFILHRSLRFNRLVFDLEAFNSFYAPLVVHSCFVCFHLHLVYFQYPYLPFLTSFDRSFKPLSRLINDKMIFNQSFVL